MAVLTFKETVRYYKGLLQKVGWMREGVAWTVIVPSGAPLSVEEVAALVTGDPDPDLGEYQPGYPGLICLGRSDACVTLFEAEGFSLLGEQPIIGRISRNARVWHVTWNITGLQKIVLAIDGELAAVIPEFNRDLIYGPGPDAVRDVARLLGAPSTRDPLHTKAKALAIVESRTGARLHKDWLDHPQPAIALG